MLGALETPALFGQGGGELGWLYYYQQKTIVGALLGGLIGVELIKKRLGVQVSSGLRFGIGAPGRLAPPAGEAGT